jgi:cyclopropane fatty-acyl-phospholipid synthase-like methyltransferase
MTCAYRDFPFPLNVFMHVLTLEDGQVRYLHYGLFEREDETLAGAQERSTALLLESLPSPPCRLLEVGIGLGTTIARLAALGYDVEGISPDERQVSFARQRLNGRGNLHAVSLEGFTTDRRYDAIAFQESSQYIDSKLLFRKCRELAAPGAAVVVLDEFSIRPVERSDALHRLDRFLAAARAEGFRLEREIDLSRQAAPTVSYFMARLPRYKAPLIQDLGLTPEQVDGLIESGKGYADLYRSGRYGYRLLRFLS